MMMMMMMMKKITLYLERVHNYSKNRAFSWPSQTFLVLLVVHALMFVLVEAGRGRNLTLFLMSIAKRTVHSVEIFNRWQEKLFV